jgi:hypothetical protein
MAGICFHQSVFGRAAGHRRRCSSCLCDCWPSPVSLGGGGAPPTRRGRRQHRRDLRTALQNLGAYNSGAMKLRISPRLNILSVWIWHSTIIEKNIPIRLSSTRTKVVRNKACVHPQLGSRPCTRGLRCRAKALAPSQVPRTAEPLKTETPTRRPSSALPTPIPTSVPTLMPKISAGYLS